MALFLSLAVCLLCLFQPVYLVRAEEKPAMPGPASAREIEGFRLIEVLNVTLQENPHDYQARDALAFTYTSFGLWSKAVPEIRRLIDRYPRDPAYYNNLGWAYLNLGLYEKAERPLRRALSLAPDNSFARYNLTVTLQGKERALHNPAK